jgi:prevent-host-death family protein
VAWQVQEAKQKFSRLVRCALDEGPQVVTRRGEEVVVVLSADEYRRLTGQKMSLAEFLLADGPDFSLLEIERSKDLPREIDL